MSAGIIAAPVDESSYVDLKPNSSKLFPVKDSVAWTRKTVSNGSKTHCMKTWNPIDNKKFETLSYLPPLSDESIAKEIEYMLKKGWVPCLEFDKVGHVHREHSRMPGYYDGRYWTLWKLPMFGWNDSSQMKSMIARRLTQIRIFVAWPSTASPIYSTLSLNFFYTLLASNQGDPRLSLHLVRLRVCRQKMHKKSNKRFFLLQVCVGDSCGI
ncbi:hypothetical protein CsSME_00035504 [Camellia sinensis var. sinensis]